MPQFRNINYGRVLYEGLRGYFSINDQGDISILFKILACFVEVLQKPFDNYNTSRDRSAIIAACKWQIGQLTNVLNYLFDNALNRISITQSVSNPIAATTIDYPAIISATVIDEAPDLFLRTLDDRAAHSTVAFNIPNTVSVSQITAVIEQIKIDGIPYQINVT